MHTLSYYTDRINTILPVISMNDTDVPMLYDPVRYTLQGGGKRLRPVLVLMCCEAICGECERAMSAAAGVEIFHNFTLLHDDVMDKSDTRRGRPTVHARWNENTAILSGDAMLTLATQLVMNVENSVLRKVMDTFNRCALDVYEGQAFDMEFEIHPAGVSMTEYLHMIGLKTGALLGASCKIGALIGGADAEVSDAFYEFGMKLGLAFQIHDDYLDMYGDPATFGKPIGGDVQNNKQCYLLVSGLSEKGETSHALRKAIEMPRGKEKLTVFREIYDSMGMAKRCEEATEKYCCQAIASLKKTRISPEAESCLAELANKLTSRIK